MPTPAAPRPPAKSDSPGRRASPRFRRNLLGFWSLVLFSVLVVLSLFAELLSTDKPLVVRYEGQTYFPVLRDYSEKTFGGDFETPADYLDPFIRDRITAGANWALYAPNPYGPRTLNYFAKQPNPAAPSGENLLGTDDRGRDLLAQLIYGFRVSVLFALALTLIGLPALLAPSADQARRPGEAARRRWLAVLLVLGVAVASLALFNRDAELDDTAFYFFGAYGLGMLVFWIGRATRASTWQSAVALLLLVGTGALALEWLSLIHI